MSKPWGSIGDWAADVEREEQEAAANAAASGNFPSLRESVSAKPKKKKMPLNELYSSSSVTGSRSLESKGLTPDEMLRLPTGPKERSAEEMQYGRLGGGFSNYGRTGSGSGPGRARDNEGGWGGANNRRQYGGFEEERRGGGGPPPRVSDYDQPSRADEVDNWAIAKKTPITTSFDSSIRQNLGTGGFGSSRADEVDNWTRSKDSSFTTPTSNRSNFGSGFRDSGVAGPDVDRWTRRRGGIQELERERERPRLVLDPPKGEIGGGGGGDANEVVRTNRSNPFGEARPREQVLAGKGLDWKKLDKEIEAKKSSSHSSRPTSAHSSRPSSAHSARSEEQGGLQQGLDNLVLKPRPKVNPFGDAKPREVLLQERGQDWRKIDFELEHRRVDRPETEEEKLLKEEIEHLKKKAQKQEPLPGSGEKQPSLQDIVAQKEIELEQMIRDFDDKVRFGRKAIERPASSAGSASSFSERPPSQSGSVDEHRTLEYMDRSQSRGTQDGWTRPGDERRRERDSLGSRDFDRSRSRERW